MKKQKFDYFEAFCLQAQIASVESRALVDILESYNCDSEDWIREQVQKVHDVERQADQVCLDIIEHLAVEFMPPIDREDVTELAFLLDDVTDLIEEVVQHLYMYNVRELHPRALAVALVIDRAVEALLEATKAFREFKKPKKLDSMLAAVHAEEDLGDDLYIEAKRDIFTNHPDASASYLLTWNSMFTHMERCCDTCSRAASTMKKIALKNS